MAKSSSKKQHIEEMRTKIKLEPYGLENTHSTDFPGAYDGYDDKWDFEEFKKKFKIIIKNYENLYELEFDMIGIDAAIANAFRRILLAEVPTMAIEKVHFYNNTSVIQDEVLAHRLGLIPLKADPRLFKYKTNQDSEGNDDDTLKFDLQVKCKSNPNSTDPKNPYIDSKVLTSHVKWIPIGNQANMFTADDVGPIHNDILIAKMRPGHELDLKLYAVKGVGKDHAKFSPVATAFYRLMPEIILTKDMYDEEAEKLQSCFSSGVIDLVEENGRKKAVVKNPRLDLCSRQVFMYDEFKDCVKLNKIRDHFIFSIESTGALPSDVLMKESIKIMMNKCKTLLNEINKYNK